ncbi:MAG: trigger factor [Syntrophobacteraceae bacterium]|nr:trigger factor [Syntrophobacteraceae bacterium]
MEINVSLTDISPSQKKLRVEVPESRVAKELDKRYRDLAKKAKVKGFRPGKVPLSIIKSYYGKAIQQEVSSQFIQDTFGDALKEADLKPLTQADVSESNFEESGAFSYTAMVDVCPPFELPAYKELKLYRPAAEVPEEQIRMELDKLLQSHAQLRAVEEERPIAQGDVVSIDFTPYLGEEAFEKGKTEQFLTEIGKGDFHPGFDEKLVGRKPGESFSFDREYPENASPAEFSGKSVRFDVTIKEIKEKEVPELNDEFAQSIGTGQFETLQALKDKIRESLLERAQQRNTQIIRDQILSRLTSTLDFEISPRVVEAEAERILQNLKLQFESQGLKFDVDAFNKAEYKTGTMLQAETEIRTRIVMGKIADAEAVSLSAEEEEQVLKDIASMYRLDLEKVKREFSESEIVEREKERRIQDKVFTLIENQAVMVDTPEETVEPQLAPEAVEAPKDEQA